MDTTTPDEGAVTAQPDQTPAAVTTGHNADQIITNDENGAPTLAPVTSDAPEEPSQETPSADEAVSETETQAKLDDDIVAWTEKKGLKINPDNPNEVKLAQMQRDAERKMHAATQPIVSVQPAEELELTGDPNYDVIAERLNRQEQLSYVRNWFDANPTAKDNKAELQQIATARPWLTNMDDVYAHFLANPSREADIKKQGGKEALTNLAQKQSQVPPASGATNSGVYQSETITPRNVYDLVDKNDQAWFEKNHDAISRAMSGK